MAPTPPAAPSRCPIADFVALTAMEESRPNTLLMALISPRSPTGVEVACALRWRTSRGEIPAWAIAISIARRAPSPSSESDSKYVFDISGACESAGKQANAGNQDPCFRAGDGCFEVFGEPTVAAEPGEASLDHPTSRFGLKRPKALGTSDDRNSPLAQISECVEHLRTSIDAVGKDVTQFGEHAPDDPQ